MPPPAAATACYFPRVAHQSGSLYATPHPSRTYSAPQPIAEAAHQAGQHPR